MSLLGMQLGIGNGGGTYAIRRCFEPSNRQRLGPRLDSFRGAVTDFLVVDFPTLMWGKVSGLGLVPHPPAP